MSRLVFAALVLVVSACGGEQQADIGSPWPPADWSSLAPGWSELPAPPYSAACATSVWTGTELFYWGGDEQCSEGAVRNEGAAFDPATGSWRRLPPSPLGGRSSAAAVWTGEELLVWGGWNAGVEDSGAAYRPATDEWRVLSESPLDARIPVAAVWTGQELLVWGDVSRAGETTDGAAYDPANDSWRPLAPAPFGLNQATAVWTGREMIVYGALLDSRNSSDEEHASGLAYDPRGRFLARARSLSALAASVDRGVDGRGDGRLGLRPARSRLRPRVGHLAEASRLAARLLRVLPEGSSARRLRTRLALRQAAVLDSPRAHGESSRPRRDRS